MTIAEVLRLTGDAQKSVNLALYEAGTLGTGQDIDRVLELLSVAHRKVVDASRQLWRMEAQSKGDTAA